MHVLIIEDEALLAMNLQYFLEELGADSTSLAASQSEAIREALRHPPDLIASDVRLAEGTGPDAVKAIRASLGDIPVIYVTASPEEVRAVDPSSPVIEKPVKWLELARATQNYGLPPKVSAAAA